MLRQHNLVLKMIMRDSVFFIFIFTSLSAIIKLQASANQENEVPAFLPGASYLSQDGLSIIVTFDKPVNLSVWLSQDASNDVPSITTPEQCSAQANAGSLTGRALAAGQPVRAIQGIQLCARMLTKRTLKLLHSKYKLRNCLWASRIQFIAQLFRQVAPTGAPLRIAFQRRALVSSGAGNAELALELTRLPLESMGVALSPRLALTGPNQVPPCGFFSLSAHLFAPYGSQPEEAVSLSWRVERLGHIPVAGSNNSTNQALLEANELRWRALERLVATTKSNNLILDAQLLQQPATLASSIAAGQQIYQFHLSATFAGGSALGQTSSINLTHRISQLDFGTPIGTVYGTHLLQLNEQVNPQQDLQLLADIQVPECAANTKQVGLYWQVSDQRVKFEQTYAPFYLARAGSLPEQSELEFRVNLFYGMRVKRFASSSISLSTGDSLLEAQISNGLLVMSSGAESDNEYLELFATDPHNSSRPDFQHAHLWSCFDGKTGQPCRIASATGSSSSPSAASSQRLGEIAGGGSTIAVSSNSTRYELSTAHSARRIRLVPEAGGLLVDRDRQRELNLKIPMNWLEPDAQLWFGLQRFEPRQQVASGQKALSEHALFNLQAGVRGPSPQVALGPVLVGSSRQRATIRNPLTGALLLVEGVPVVIVGRLSPRVHLRSFSWRSSDYIHPLQWTARNSTNPSTGKAEILTELHLNQELQLAHGHYQFQLIACTQSGSIVEASLALDVVPSVSQCLIVPSVSPVTESLVVSVDYCNIPLGLSPITYQLYLIDRATNHLQELNELQANSNGSNETLSISRSSESAADHYLDSSDEAQLEARAQPLTPAQLSPVFHLSSLSSRMALTSLLGTSALGSSNQLQSQVRFAAKVCDKAQSCHMFYSRPISAQLLSTSRSNLAAQASSSVTTSQQVVDLTQWLQSNLDASWRANKAGNSVAAISILNSAINLAQRTANSLTPSSSLDAASEKLRNLLQVSVRELLQYATLSITRQFHYINSGQTNLVTTSLARILTMPQSSLESKFRAIRVMAQVTRKTIAEQQQSKLNCLADFKTIQAAYESLLGTFSHYHLHEGSSEKWVSSASGMRSVAIALTMVNSTSPPPLSPEKTQASKKKREDAILAYLKSVRQAARALIAAASIQLPLGDSQQFHYTSITSSSSSPNSELSSEATSSSRSSAERIIAASPSRSGRSSPVAAPLQVEAARVPASDIVTSLTHVTELTDESIDIELLEFGSVTLRFHPSFVSKLSGMIESAQLNCMNGTKTKKSTVCSSIVLALTTYAGKAPYRSLDDTLRVPLLEVNLLSPIDGSNLLEYQTDLMTSETFKIDVRFTAFKSQDSSISARPFGENLNQQLKCYQFNEEIDEWSRASVVSESFNRTPEENNRDLVISCTFNGPGVFAAFIGEPTASFGALKSSTLAIIIGISCTILILFLCTCFSSCSSSKSKRKRKDNQSEKSNDADDESSSNVRHPEQTYRNEFNYPV